MESYRYSEPWVENRVKSIVVLMILVGTLISTAVVFLKPGRQQSDNYLLDLGILAVLMLIFVFTALSQRKKLAEKLSTIEIQIDSFSISLYQQDMNPIRILKSEISSIERSPSGTIVIRSPEKERVIGYRPGIVGYEELTENLQELSAIRERDSRTDLLFEVWPMIVWIISFLVTMFSVSPFMITAALLMLVPSGYWMAKFITDSKIVPREQRKKTSRTIICLTLLGVLKLYFVWAEYFDILNLH